MPALNLDGVLTASIGVAQYVPDSDAATSVEIVKGELLRRADAAMYRAKSLGKNQCVVWDHSLLAAAQSGLSEAK
jgi:PleD family two-component response regulator